MSVVLTAVPALSNPLYTTSVGIRPQPPAPTALVVESHNGHYARQRAVQSETREKRSSRWGGMLVLNILVRSRALQEHEIVGGQAEKGATN